MLAFLLLPPVGVGGATSKEFGLEISRSRVQILYNLRQVVHTCASVTKQYNLVPAKGR